MKHLRLLAHVLLTGERRSGRPQVARAALEGSLARAAARHRGDRGQRRRAAREPAVCARAQAVPMRGALEERGQRVHQCSRARVRDLSQHLLLSHLLLQATPEDADSGAEQNRAVIAVHKPYVMHDDLMMQEPVR